MNTNYPKQIKLKKAPCKDCKKRWANEHTTCHSTCPEYKKWKRYVQYLHNLYNEEMKLNKDSYSMYESSIIFNHKNRN